MTFTCGKGRPGSYSTSGKSKRRWLARPDVVAGRRKIIKNGSVCYSRYKKGRGRESSLHGTRPSFFKCQVLWSFSKAVQGCKPQSINVAVRLNRLTLVSGLEHNKVEWHTELGISRICKKGLSSTRRSRRSIIKMLSRSPIGR